MKLALNPIFRAFLELQYHHSFRSSFGQIGFSPSRGSNARPPIFSPPGRRKCGTIDIEVRLHIIAWNEGRARGVKFLRWVFIIQMKRYVPMNSSKGWDPRGYIKGKFPRGLMGALFYNRLQTARKKTTRDEVLNVLKRSHRHTFCYLNRIVWNEKCHQHMRLVGNAESMATPCFQQLSACRKLFSQIYSWIWVTAVGRSSSSRWSCSYSSSTSSSSLFGLWVCRAVPNDRQWSCSRILLL